MILLALGSGRRLDFVHHPGAIFLQTLLWILCAAVCGTEQYFNVEVRVLRCLSSPGWAAPDTLDSTRTRLPRAAGVCTVFSPVRSSCVSPSGSLVHAD